VRARVRRGQAGKDAAEPVQRGALINSWLSGLTITEDTRKAMLAATTSEVATQVDCTATCEVAAQTEVDGQLAELRSQRDNAVREAEYWRQLAASERWDAALQRSDLKRQLEELRQQLAQQAWQLMDLQWQLALSCEEESLQQPPLALQRPRVLQQSPPTLQHLALQQLRVL